MTRLRAHGVRGSGRSGQSSGRGTCSTLREILLHWSREIPERPALLSPGGDALTYRDLLEWATALMGALRAHGIRPDARVAVVMPNGPDLAASVLSTACACVCVPLNPAFSEAECCRYFGDLRVDALLTRAEMSYGARAAARSMGLPVLDLCTAPGARPSIDHAAGSGRRDPVDAEIFATAKDDAFLLPTSGTTSHPKAVPLTHANVCLSARGTAAWMALVPGDRLLGVLPLHHAHGLISGLLSTIAGGASIVCTPGFNAYAFFDWLGTFEPTWYTAVPAIHQEIVRAAQRRQDATRRWSLRFIRSASSSLAADTLARLEAVFGVPVIETYGMTEASSQIASNPLPPGRRKPGSVGLAAGPELAVLDDDGHACPSRCTGHIALKGPTLTRGYQGSSAGPETGYSNGWFMTGDLGYLDEDGYLFIVGRSKEIINRGGEKIAPREVEEALLEHPGVAQAVAFAMPHERLGEEVAAVIVLQPGATAAPRALRRFTARRLAPSKVPRRVQIVSEIPKGPTGKIKRIGMADQLGLLENNLDDEKRPPYVAPRSDVEQSVHDAWSAVLDRMRIGVHEDFFLLGGDSLASARVISRIEQRLGAVLSFRDFLDTPTIAGLAAKIHGTRTTRPTLNAEPATQEEIGPCPLSRSQQRLFLLDKLDATRRAYQVVDALRLRGHVDATALGHALRDITARHEVLRASFHERDGEPFQSIAPVCPMPFRMVGATTEADAARIDAIRHAVRLEMDRPFDDFRESPGRATLFQLAPSEHLLVVSIHHLVTDGWSQMIFWTELWECYFARAAGRVPDLAPLDFSYRRFIETQGEWLRSEAAREQLRYWQTKLGGLVDSHIRADRLRPKSWSGRGARHPFQLSSTLTGKLRGLSRRHGVTPFMTLLAALSCLVSRHTGSEDVAIGSLFANRRSLKVEPLMGTFANTVALRTDLSGDPSFSELLGRVRDVTLDAYRHQEMPFEEVLRTLKAERVPGRNSLFQIMFIFQSSLRRVPRLPGMSSEFVDVDPEVARFDLTFELHESGDGMSGWIEYSTDLFRAETVADLASQFQNVLASAAANADMTLSRLALLSDAERKRILVDWNNTAVDVPAKMSVVAGFLEQALRTPGATAVSCDGKSVRYESLERWSGVIGRRLIDEGVGPDSVVAVLGERGPRYLAGLLAVLRAGGAFLPLDPSLVGVEARWLRILEQSGTALMLAEGRVASVVRQRLSGMSPDKRPRILAVDELLAEPAGEPDCAPLPAPTDLAYVIFTSGSTGVPKGAMIEHHSLTNHLLSKVSDLGLEPSDVVAQTAPQSFDIFVWQSLAPLLAGGRVHVIGDQRTRDPLALAEQVLHEGVSVLEIVPTLLRGILDAAEAGAIHLEHGRLRWLICTGEPLDPELCRRWLAIYPHVPMMNAYGPAECADDVSIHVIDEPPPDSVSSVPIGRPIANTRLYVLDTHREPAAIGAPGELYVGGAGVGRGYLNDEEETRQRFLEDSFSEQPGASMFRSGDLVRRLSDGNLEFLGRVDHQAKVRGHRIEPGEIEFWLDRHPHLRESAVVVSHCYESGPRLVAHVAARRGRHPSVGDLRRYLRARIPGIMIPSAFAFTDALPRTRHGKIDRNTLGMQRVELQVAGSPLVPPGDETQAALIGIFEELLEVERIGIHDSFFELGGHSLLAAQVLARVERTVGVAVPLRALFESPTAHDLAEHIERVRAEGGREARTSSAPDVEHDSCASSIAQEHALEVQDTFGDVPVFNLPFAYRLRGPLDLPALERSVNEIVARHEILRTSFEKAGARFVRSVAPAHATGVSLEIDDIGAKTPLEAKHQTERLASVLARERFDLSKAPLFRLRICRLGADDHVLLWTIHHLITDGWSIAMFTRELSARYEAYAAGKQVSFAKPNSNFSAFASWQRAWCESEQAAGHVDYWKKTLGDASPVYPLTDWTTVQRAFRVGREPMHVPDGLVDKLGAVAIESGGTLFMALLTAFKVLLRSHTGQRDLCIATAMANRSRFDFEDVMGPLENTTLIRTRLREEMSFAAALRAVRESLLAAHEHGEIPFETLSHRLEKERRLDLSSLLQVFFVFQGVGAGPLRLPPLVIEPFADVHRQGNAVFPVDRTHLTLLLRQTPSGLIGSCIYKKTLFDPMLIREMLHAYSVVLAKVTAAPHESIGTLVEHRAPRNRRRPAVRALL